MSMEREGCPPFCEVGCSLVHDKLLLALVGCPEGEISAEHSSLLSSIIESKWKEGWCSKEPLDDPNPDFRYPAVLWACAIGKPVLVKWLLSNGFVQDTQDEDSGDNGLHRSILCLQKSMRSWKEAISKFKELLPIMPDCLLMKNSTGYTPLHLACEMFLDKESSMDFYRDCALALFEYAQTKGEEFVSRLINSQKADGQTVLHILAHSDHTYKVLRLFVMQGKPNHLIRDDQGMTALGIAVTSAQMKSSQLLSKLQHTMISAEETVDQSTTDMSIKHPDDTEYTKIKEEPVYCDDIYTVQNSTTKSPAKTVESQDSTTESTLKSVIPQDNTTEVSSKTIKSQNNTSEKSSKTVKSQQNSTKKPSKTDKSQTKSPELQSESVKSENGSQGRSPRRAIKRKADDKLDIGTEVVQEKERSSKVLQTITDNDIACSKNLRKRCRMNLNKDSNGTEDKADSAEKNTENKEVKVNQTIEDSKRHRIKTGSPRNSPSSTGRKKSKKPTEGEAGGCPVLSSVIDEQRIEVTGKTPPTLSPQVDKATCILEKIKNKEIWNRYIQFCGKSIPESAPVLLKMSTTQLQDVFAVCPDVREKLGDYLELLNMQERLLVSPTVQELIALDPLEEKLKDHIAKEVKQNEEREFNMKRDVMELVSFEDRMKSPTSYETESPFDVRYRDSEPQTKIPKVYDDSNETDSFGASALSNKKIDPNTDIDFETVKGERSDAVNENSSANDEISALKEIDTEGEKTETVSLRYKSDAVIDSSPTDDDISILNKMRTVVMQINMDKTRSHRDKNDSVTDNSTTTNEVSALKEVEKEITETNMLNLDNNCNGDAIINDKMSEASTVIPDDAVQETEEMEYENSAFIDDVTLKSEANCADENSSVLDDYDMSADNSAALDVSNIETTLRQVVSGDVKVGNENIVENNVESAENFKVHHETNCLDEQSCIKDAGDTEPIVSSSAIETMALQVGNTDAAIQMENKDGQENAPPKLEKIENISSNCISSPGTVPKATVADEKEDSSVVEKGDRISTETSPSRPTCSNGIVAYLSYNSSTKALLRESLYRDRLECQEIWRKKQEILNNLDEKHKKLELCNNELEAEINAYMEKITELKTRLSHNKTQELELQTQIQSERAKIEQVKVKVQTCEKALEELDQ